MSNDAESRQSSKRAHDTEGLSQYSSASEEEKLNEDDDLAAKEKARQVGLEAQALSDDYNESMAIAKAMAASNRPSSDAAGSTAATTTDKNDLSKDADADGNNKGTIVALPPSNETDSNRDNAIQPGAYQVYPGGTVIPARDSTAGEDEERGDTGSATAPIDTEVQHVEDSNHVATHAYLVEDSEEPQEAHVVHTYFGIERKRLVILSSAMLGVLTISATVLGILIPRSKNGNENVCGPLCGSGTTLPYPELMVFGGLCQDWNFNSTFLPAPRKKGHASTSSEKGSLYTFDTCADVYEPVAYGCGCSDVEIPTLGCGTLCQDGSDLPDPSKIVRDINNIELSCKDWELKAQFDSDANECVNYNAVGALCGCPNNEPHPDACGTLCSTGDFYHSGSHTVWDVKCDDWNTISMFLPRWYHNDNNETCEEYYGDVSHGCACLDVKDETIAAECGTLCQERRICSPICESGDSLPDADLIVRRETCQGWEMHSRLEVHSFVCPFYHMAGAQCGCDNTPPQDACGPLCGTEGILPHPEKEVYGETCEAWDYKSRYLGQSYAAQEGETMPCAKQFDSAAYGCGCPGATPPKKSCGTLCADGSTLPDPSLIVNAKTCGDLELLSLFETDMQQCSRYAIFGELCGCPGFGKYMEECFEFDHLKNETYYISSGGSLYSISFEDGYFAQIQNNGDLFMIGNFHGFTEDNVGIYGGGAPCGTYGPRSGSVIIIEDETVAKPTVSCKSDSCFEF